MLRPLFKLLAPVLVLALVVTGHSMAVARGMPGVSGYAQYCIGESAVMVPVDANGQPTGRPHICPDFSLSLLNWMPVEVGPIVVTEGRASEFGERFEISYRVIRQITALARAPPALS